MDIALVGLGAIATAQHVPAITASPDWRLAATLSKAGTVEGVPSCDTMEQMFAQHPDIEVVSICVPPVPRFDLAAQALAAGRHVMLEKPPGATLTECRKLIDMARERGLSLYATWHSRSAGMVGPAREWLTGKTLRNLRIVWKEDVRRWHHGQEWIFEAGGTGVFDPGINALSILTAILPDPVHVADATLKVPSNRQTPIAADLTFHHPTARDCTAEFDFKYLGEPVWTIEAETDQGTMVLSFGGSQMHVYGVEQPGADADPMNAEYPRLYANMARLVADGGMDVDLAPMRLMADAFLTGRREQVEPFTF